ncbi:MAG: CoA-binding protein [Anaerosomatales bacterium]|nr:CoA-binding protein [Anaerosomatales bacterium]
MGEVHAEGSLRALPTADHDAEPLAHRPRVAIIGASADRAKYGNKAVRAYAEEGWEVWPVNPRGGRIESLPVYEDIADLPDLPQRASLYLPEEPALQALDALAALEERYGRSIQDVYLNPGVGKRAVRERADELGLNRVSRCSIRAIGRVPKEFPAE